jgi:hypothetical protein
MFSHHVVQSSARDLKLKLPSGDELDVSLLIVTSILEECIASIFREK